MLLLYKNKNRVFLVYLQSGNLRFDNQVENLYQSLHGLSAKRRSLTLDVAATNWVNPHSILGIVSVARWWHRETRHKTQLINIHEKVHLYLERMNVFDVCQAFLETPERLKSETLFDRSPNSQKLLELLPIPSGEQTNPIVVQSAMRRTKEILNTWINDSNLILSVQTLLSEIAHNITHSEDKGFATVQRYRKPYSQQGENESEIHIGIADLGIGIEKSLTRRYPNLPHDFKQGCEYIRHALVDGVSGQEAVRGIGLARVKNLVRQWNGELLIRSNKSSLRITPERLIEADNLAFMPGVQVFIVVRGKTSL